MARARSSEAHISTLVPRLTATASERLATVFLVGGRDMWWDKE